MAPTPRWAGLGPQAHRKVGLTKMSSMSLSLSLCQTVSLVSTPQHRNTSQPTQVAFDCINETKNLEKDKGNTLGCFCSEERPSQVTSHHQDGQSKNSLHPLPMSASLRGERKSQSFWMTNWSITGTSASQLSTGGTVGEQRTWKHLGTKAFCHGSSTAGPHRHSCSQAPPSQPALAGMCSAGSWE